MASGPDPDLTIVLLGNTGVGKSASGNTILGREEFESRPSFGSVTKQISEVSGTVSGQRLLLVDTPGILGSETEIQTKCEELLKSSRPCLFLLVIKLDRFTTEQNRAAEAVIRVIGDQGLKNCFLLFTRGDGLGRPLEDFLYDDPDGPLIPLVKRFNGRRHMFNNVNREQQQVRKLLEKSGHLQPDFLPESMRRIVLLGLPGGGKSSTGNTILGSKRFRSGCHVGPVSIETVTKSAEVEGRWVTVVDTPGFSEEIQSQSQLTQEIRRLLEAASPGADALVIVVKPGSSHKTDSLLLEMLLTTLSHVAQNYAMVVFTHGDELGGGSIEEMIQSNPCVFQLVSMCGQRHCVFDNTGKRSRRQVQDFMSKMDEMVSANGRILCTLDMFSVDQTFRWTDVFCCCCRNRSSGTDEERQRLLPGNQGPRSLTIN